MGFLLKCLDICLFQLAFRSCCSTVRLKLLGAVRLLHQMTGTFCGFFQFVSGLHAHIVILGFADLFMKMPPDNCAGGILCCKGQL